MEQDSEVESMRDDKAKSKAFWVLIVFTLGYIGIYYFLVLETKVCAAETPISPHWFKGFFDAYLGCVGVNELGDALAGAFAPVAFLWLAGAVFIQSQELAAQREELDATRKVMKEQVEETRASTSLFKEQTEVLKLQQALRDQEQADERFDALISSLRNNVVGANGMSIGLEVWKYNRAGRRVSENPFYSLCAQSQGAPDQLFFAHLRGGVQRFISEATNHARVNETVTIRSLPSFFSVYELSRSVRELKAQCAFLSPSHEVKAQSFDLDAVDMLLEELSSMLQKLDANEPPPQSREVAEEQDTSKDQPP